MKTKSNMTVELNTDPNKPLIDPPDYKNFLKQKPKELDYCPDCNQMTNHKDGKCLKCKPKELECRESIEIFINQIIDDLAPLAYRNGSYEEYKKQKEEMIDKFQYLFTQQRTELEIKQSKINEERDEANFEMAEELKKVALEKQRTELLEEIESEKSKHTPNSGAGRVLTQLLIKLKK